MIKLRLAILVTLMLANTGSAAKAQVDPEVDRFIKETGRYCVTAASIDCFERVFVFVDRNGEGVLSAPELKQAREQLGAWYEAEAGSLDPSDRGGLLLALAAMDALGVENLIRLYDENGDGVLSRDEAGADLTLDRRTFPMLASRGEAVDWIGLRQRLGASAAILDYLGIP